MLTGHPNQGSGVDYSIYDEKNIILFTYTSKLTELHHEKKVAKAHISSVEATFSSHDSLEESSRRHAILYKLLDTVAFLDKRIDEVTDIIAGLNNATNQLSQKDLVPQKPITPTL